MQTGFLFSDDYIPYFKVREVEIVENWEYLGPVLRLRFLIPDPKVPGTVQVFARYPGFDHYLESGRQVTVNITSDVPELPLEKAFHHPTKVLLAIGLFSHDFPAYDRSFCDGLD